MLVPDNQSIEDLEDELYDEDVAQWERLKDYGTEDYH